MKSTFSRLFSTIAVILLLAILLLGASFRALVKNYLADNATEKLQNDAQVIADLASVYYSDGSLYNISFLTKLTVASSVSEADSVK